MSSAGRGVLFCALLIAGCKTSHHAAPAPASSSFGAAAVVAPADASDAHVSAIASVDASDGSLSAVGSAQSLGVGSADASTSAAALALPNVATEWCLEGWRGLDEANCYWIPDGGSEVLLIYLSGIVPPQPKSPQKENVQRVVTNAARRAAAAALLPRGRRGIGPTDAKDWWAWPTGPADIATYGTTMVNEWKAARAKLEAALGRPFKKMYLAGSSSGAYFLTALALSGAIEADGYCAASGGAPGLGGGGGQGGGVVAKHPFYVGYGTADPTNSGPKALGAFLKSAGWPVKLSEHPFPHGAREEYLNEAFTFWTQVPANP